ncbi:MAG: hypothetical protein ACUVQ7_01725, partial [bacterium]
IRIKSEFLLLGRALNTYEEVGKGLDPGFNVLDEARLILRDLALRKAGFTRFVRLEVLRDLLSSLLSIP